jgi:hypothetical protein
MPSAVKDLSTLASTLELNLSNYPNAREGAFQYIAGTGTVLLEGTLQVSGAGTWFTLIDFEGNAIAGLTGVGVTRFPISGYARIRGRNTSGGAANLSALGFS